MGKKINGMSASFYKLMYYPPERSEYNETSKSFFDTMKDKEVDIAKTKQGRNGTSTTSITRGKRKTNRGKV
jgi:hypothetical protein|tara:strand:- start:912 stop:1124 length:213 start_codon:yes stop_codon:yes gene_type:complete